MILCVDRYIDLWDLAGGVENSRWKEIIHFFVTCKVTVIIIIIYIVCVCVWGGGGVFLLI